MKSIFFNIIIIFGLISNIIAETKKAIEDTPRTQIQMTGERLSNFFLIFKRGPIYRFDGKYSIQEENFFKDHHISETKLFIDYCRYEMKSNFSNHLLAAVKPQFKEYYKQLPQQHARVMDYYVFIFKERARADYNVITDEQVQFLQLWDTPSPFHFLKQNNRYLQRIKNNPLFLNSINQVTYDALFAKKSPKQVLVKTKLGRPRKKKELKKAIPIIDKDSLMINAFFALFKRGPQYHFKGEYSVPEVDFFAVNKIAEDDIFIKYCIYFDLIQPQIAIDTLNKSLQYIYHQSLYLEYVKVYNEFIPLFESYLLDRKKALNKSQLAYIKRRERKAPQFFVYKLMILLKNDFFYNLITDESINILISSRLIFHNEKEYARMMNEFVSFYERYPNINRAASTQYTEAELSFYQKWSIYPPSESRVYNIFMYYRNNPDFIAGLNERSLKIFFPPSEKEITSKLKELFSHLELYKHPYIIKKTETINENIISSETISIMDELKIIAQNEINTKENQINKLRTDTTLNRQTALIILYRDEINELKDMQGIATSTIVFLQKNIEEGVSLNPLSICEIGLKRILQF